MIENNSIEGSVDDLFATVVIKSPEKENKIVSSSAGGFQLPELANFKNSSAVASMMGLKPVSVTKSKGSLITSSILVNPFDRQSVEQASTEKTKYLSFKTRDSRLGLPQRNFNELGLQSTFQKKNYLTATAKEAERKEESKSALQQGLSMNGTKQGTYKIMDEQELDNYLLQKQGVGEGTASAEKRKKQASKGLGLMDFKPAVR